MRGWLVGGCGVDVSHHVYGLCVVVCVYGGGCVFAYVRTCQCVRVVCLCLYACLFLCIAAQSRCDCVHASVFEYPRSKAQNKSTHSL